MIPTTAPISATLLRDSSEEPRRPVPPPAAEASDAPPEPPTPPVTLAVVPWVDQVLLHRGHDPRSDYVERFWLPIIGPSTTLLIRRLARGFDEMPAGYRINVADTARALGLGEGTGRNSMISRSIDRACQFGMAQRHGVDRLSVRTHLPPLTQRQLTRLPLAVRNAHQRWIDEHREEVGRVVTHAPPAPPRLPPAA